MSGLQELAAATVEISELLSEVLATVLGEEVLPAEPDLPSGDLATARVAIHDELADGYALVEVRVGLDLGHVLASRMMGVADPSGDDIIDAVAELDNICAGNLKTLLCEHSRISLPSAQILAGPPAAWPAGVQVGAVVREHVAALGIHRIGQASIRSEGLYWPPAEPDDEVLQGAR